MKLNFAIAILPVEFFALADHAAAFPQGNPGQVQPHDQMVVLRKTAPTVMPDPPENAIQDFVASQIDGFVGAVFIVSGSDSDGSTDTHGRLSIGFCTNDLNGLVPEQRCISERAYSADDLTVDNAVTSA